MAQIPVIYPNELSIQNSRERYNRELTNLQEIIPLKTSHDIEAAAEPVGSHLPFYLTYQNLNDRELQELYGQLVCKIMSLRYPHFAERPVMPNFSHKEPLRIGFVSGFFFTHSNWKIPMKGWVENINKQRFMLYGYSTGRIKDEQTLTARQKFNRFVDDVNSFEGLCETIRKDNLHVLIYPEIGMNSMTVRLASLRLAPVQCNSWGHPETSGFPTIDYYLSSDLMEPPDAEDHYSERLIRLPNLSIYYIPLNIPQIEASRASFGLRSNSILYFCGQSLFKYLPQHDDIYPRIAKKVHNCQFVFISHPKSNFVTMQFRSRLRDIFDRFNMNVDDYVIFIETLEPYKFFAINRLSDIFLDTIDWSGCNTTL
jgi:predicted O-linked N-acetylglucosamine transferase (SPINDLY family)